MKIYIKSKNLKKFNKYFKKYRVLLKILLLSMIIASSFGLILTYFMSKRLISVTENNIVEVIKFSAFTMLVILIHHIGWYLWEKIAEKISIKVNMDIKNDIYKKIINLKYSKIKNKTSGYFLERLNDDILEVSHFRTTFMGTLIDMITNFSFLILIFILNWQSGLIFLIGIIIIYLIELLKIKKDLIYTEKLKEYTEKYNSKINESISGIKDIKLLGIKQEMVSITNNINEQMSKIEIKRASNIAFYSRIKTFLQYLLETILIIFAIVYLIPEGMLSVVILLVVLNYTGMMFEVIEYLSILKSSFENGELKAKRLLEIIESKEVEEFLGYDKIFKSKENSIKVNNLSYEYKDNPNKKILKNIDFEIKGNSLNVFVGNSGSGKSTLFSLLCKLNEVQDNKIVINNKCINLYSEKELRDTVSIVNQEIFLINDTIMENLKIVNKNANDKEIYKACKIANIYDEIMGFSDGFNTNITENGSNLSTGQKQRISIVRAVLRNTPIILFDEPTSALDKLNHDLFFKTLGELKKSKLILVIAHKLEERKEIDNILKLEKGTLKEECNN